MFILLFFFVCLLTRRKCTILFFPRSKRTQSYASHEMSGAPQFHTVSLKPDEQKKKKKKKKNGNTSARVFRTGRTGLIKPGNEKKERPREKNLIKSSNYRSNVGSCRTKKKKKGKKKKKREHNVRSDTVQLKNKRTI
mgnify:CR=1 FL=1